MLSMVADCVEDGERTCRERGEEAPNARYSQSKAIGGGSKSLPSHIRWQRVVGVRVPLVFVAASVKCSKLGRGYCIVNRRSQNSVDFHESSDCGDFSD
jgi:hypothetical protein